MFTFYSSASTNVYIIYGRIIHCIHVEVDLVYSMKSIIKNSCIIDLTKYMQ